MMMQAYEILENEFSMWQGVGNCVACNSGTAALHLALESLGLPKGSRVLVPEYTYIATARAVSLAGLVPVFVDCNENMLMDLNEVERLDEPGMFSAVLPVHVYGRAVDINRLKKLVGGIRIISDCAQAHGLKNASWAENAMCWSFQATKVIHGEEGGLVAFPTMEGHTHAAKARLLRSFGSSSGNFLHQPYGCNYRMTNGQANLIRSSLSLADGNIVARRRVETWYDELIPQEWLMPKRGVVWLYDLRIGANHNNEEIVTKMRQRGIPCRVGFKPMSMQPEYLGNYRHLTAYQASRQIICLPVEATMTRDECEVTVNILKEVVAQN